MSCIRAASWARLHTLRSEIFQTSYNPTGVRTGAKYLRARLRGPSMLQYYPKGIDMAWVVRKHPELGAQNLDELQRLDDLDDRKARGKGAPKKAKDKSESRRLARKR